MLLRATATWDTVLDTVLLPIIVGDLVSGLYALERHNKYPALVDCRLCVWAAGMIDISRLINGRLPVYGLCL